jgi:hypothetical protein
MCSTQTFNINGLAIGFNPDGRAARGRIPPVRARHTRFPETEPHPEQLAKRFENVSLAFLFLPFEWRGYNICIDSAFGQGTSDHGGSCLGPFKLNGSKTTGSCTPPFKSLESVANDTFSIRFDNGFGTLPRIAIWDPGSTAAALGE